MILFELPWAFLLLPAPLLVKWLSAAYHTPRAALRVPLFHLLVRLSGNRPGRGALILRRNIYQRLTLAVSWIAVVTALANPVWLGDPIVKQQPTRDLMLALDLSASMETEDFAVDTGTPLSRFDGVREVVSTFVAQRRHDRVGLIVFGSAPYLQVPFTLDHDLYLQLLRELQTGMAGPKTMLGDAVGLAVNHFTAAEEKRLLQGRKPASKVLILLTDGNDSGSRVPPLDAARVAADAGIVIHTIAIGKLTADGDQRVDVESLAEISQTTGGVFFRAEDGAELQKIYAHLDRLEPEKVDAEYFRPRFSLFHWPLGLALCLQLILQFTMAWWSSGTGIAKRGSKKESASG
ncbi:VWA domain-containing protein [Pseudomaricurvus alkylphenolicus]|uniref:VWA domain-containing protein n=1 Tax=Pseudomaricurvus alkylphenolicus TaxID=1306991 RepID=UPI00141EF28B|nr:VWA domain-containing protein [Pseudomaricurvus alkylphenolicus]